MAFGKSSSLAFVQQTVDNQNAGFSDITGTAANIKGAGNTVQGGSGNVAVTGNKGTVNLLDGGAISEAFSFAKDISTQSTKRFSEAIQSVNESARTETENTGQGFLKVALWAVVIFGGVWAIKAFKG